MDSRIIEWDGDHVPDELRRLPPGRYIVEPVDVPLTTEEEDGIVAAVAELDAGQGVPLADVMRAIQPETPAP